MSISLIKLQLQYIELDFKSQCQAPYVFRRYRSGDVTSFSFRFVLLCCAVSTSQLRSDSVFTHFHSHSRTATRSATSEYGTVPERPSRNEELNSRN